LGIIYTYEEGDTLGYYKQRITKLISDIIPLVNDLEIQKSFKDKDKEEEIVYRRFKYNIKLLGRS